LLAAHRKLPKLKHRRQKLLRHLPLHLPLLLQNRPLLLLHLPLLLLLAKLHLLLHLLQNKFLNKGLNEKETEETLSLFFVLIFHLSLVFDKMVFEKTKKRHGCPCLFFAWEAGVEPTIF
jgi:hypothetical protein